MVDATCCRQLENVAVAGEILGQEKHVHSYLLLYAFFSYLLVAYVGLALLLGPVGLASLL